MPSLVEEALSLFGGTDDCTQFLQVENGVITVNYDQVCSSSFAAATLTDIAQALEQYIAQLSQNISPVVYDMKDSTKQLQDDVVRLHSKSVELRRDEAELRASVLRATDQVQSCAKIATNMLETQAILQSALSITQAGSSMVDTQAILQAAQTPSLSTALLLSSTALLAKKISQDAIPPLTSITAVSRARARADEAASTVLHVSQAYLIDNIKKNNSIPDGVEFLQLWAEYCNAAGQAIDALQAQNNLSDQLLDLFKQQIASVFYQEQNLGAVMALRWIIRAGPTLLRLLRMAEAVDRAFAPQIEDEKQAVATNETSRKLLSFALAQASSLLPVPSACLVEQHGDDYWEQIGRLPVRNELDHHENEWFEAFLLLLRGAEVPKLVPLE